MFYPDPAYVCSLRAGGPTHFLAPGKGGSPLSTPSRPSPHDVGTSGVASCADPPPPATASHRLPNSQTANGARSRRAAPLSQYVTEPGDSREQINPFSPTRRRSPVDHSLVAKGVQSQRLQACLADGLQPQCLSFPCVLIRSHSRHKRSIAVMSLFPSL